MITLPSVQFTLVPLISIPQCVSGIFNPRCILSLRWVLAKYDINHLTFWPIIQKKGIPPGVSWSTMGYHPCVRIQNAPLGCASLTRSKDIRIQQLVDNVTRGLCGLADFFLRWPPISPDSRAHEVQLVPGALLDKPHLVEPLHLGPQRLPLLSHLPPVVLQPGHHVLCPLPQLVKTPHILGS